MSNIPIYVPESNQEGGTVLPIYLPEQYGGLEIPVYQPRQRGGGGFKNMGSAILRMGRAKLDHVKNEAIHRGAEAMTRVAEDVMDGKDLQQALHDEGTKARIDLKRKAESVASKAEGVKKSVKSHSKRYTKAALNAIFD